MMARADKTLAAVDASKVGRASFAHIAGIEGIDILVTDDKASQEELALIREKGVRILVV
jgi:DeoR/GlpR family transcriptional regulator of sugar metabolism